LIIPPIVKVHNKKLKKEEYNKKIEEEKKKVDPLNVRELEILSGNERKELLEDIIQVELAKQNKFPMLLI